MARQAGETVDTERKSANLVEWDLEMFQEEFLESLQWAQCWTLCHGRDWKQPRDLRFRLWDPALQSGLLLLPVLLPTIFRPWSKDSVTVPFGQGGFGTRQILHHSLLRRQTWASTEVAFSHCTHAYYRREIIDTHSYHPVPHAKPDPKQVNEGSPLRSFIITEFGCCLKQEHAWSRKRKREEQPGTPFYMCIRSRKFNKHIQKHSLQWFFVI